MVIALGLLSRKAGENSKETENRQFPAHRLPTLV
jgi:hypothetical protein